MIPTREIHREHIVACCDVDRLHDWHSLFMDYADEIASDLFVRTTTGQLRDDWQQRAAWDLKAAHMAMRRIERRVIELGGELILSREGAERAEIVRLRARIRELERELRGAMAA